MTETDYASVRPRVYAVLMAGGAGTRFWPLSRRTRPKQVLSIADQRPMIRVTVDRLGDLVPPERVIVVTGADQAAPIRAALPEVPAENYLLEPMGRDTAACVGWAAGVAKSRDPGAVLLCLPADHVIEPEETFRAACRRAILRADAAKTLLTFGIEATSPSERYGYIREGAETAPGVRAVRNFEEKPVEAVAKEYLASGDYRWNSGMFVWRADVFLPELAAHQPELADGLEAIVVDPDRVGDVFPRLPRVQVDRGVMEKTAKAEVLAADFEWDDVGAFDALPRRLTPDADGNCSVGQLLAVDSKDALTVAPDGHLIALLGVADLVVVATEDATLVCSRDRVEDVRRIVEGLPGCGREDLR